MPLELRGYEELEYGEGLYGGAFYFNVDISSGVQGPILPGVIQPPQPRGTIDSSRTPPGIIQPRTRRGIIQ